MLLKRIAIISTTALIAIAAEASAQTINAQSDTSSNAALSIQALPKSGSVQISGMVKDIKNDKKFILEDSAGKTIDVNSNANLQVKEGEKITVNGTLNSEILGLGKEINNATVSRSSDLDNRDTLSSKDSDDHEDLDEENASANDSSIKKSIDLIKNLPEEGRIEISGKVSEVNDNGVFILQDRNGDTVDVHSGSKLSVSEGDKVKVIGRVTDEAAKMGEEITAEEVIKL